MKKEEILELDFKEITKKRLIELWGDADCLSHVEAENYKDCNVGMSCPHYFTCYGHIF